MELVEVVFEIFFMRSFWERKRIKINLKIRLKKKVEELFFWVKNLFNFFEFFVIVVIFWRLFLFVFMVGWSIVNFVEGGFVF